MANSQIFSAALRIGDTAIARTALEEALGIKLARYEPARSGPLNYAQINISIEEDVWGSITDCMRTIGPQISILRDERQIGSASIDLAVSFADGQMSLSVAIPSQAAKIISGYGIDIEFSVYAVNEGE